MDLVTKTIWIYGVLTFATFIPVLLVNWVAGIIVAGLCVAFLIALFPYLVDRNERSWYTYNWKHQSKQRSLRSNERTVQDLQTKIQGLDIKIQELEDERDVTYALE